MLSRLCVLLSCLALLHPGRCNTEVTSEGPTERNMSATIDRSAQTSKSPSDPTPSSPSSGLSTSTLGRGTSLSSSPPNITHRRLNTTTRPSFTRPSSTKTSSTRTSSTKTSSTRTPAQPSPDHDCLFRRKHGTILVMVGGALVVLCTVLMVVSMVLSCQLCSLRRQVVASQGQGGRVVRSNVDLVNTYSLGGTARRKEQASETSLLMKEQASETSLLMKEVRLSLEGAEGEEDQEKDDQEKNQKENQKENQKDDQEKNQEKNQKDDQEKNQKENQKDDQEKNQKENQEKENQKEEKGGDEASRPEGPRGSEGNSTLPPAGQGAPMATETTATPGDVVA